MPGYGQPPPSAAYSGAGQLAERPQRVLGTLVDLVPMLAIWIPGIILAAIFGAISSALGFLVNLVVFVVWLGYWVMQLIKQGNTGQTIGKKIMGLKVISESTGQPIGPGPSVVRALAHFVDSIICYIGYLFPLWDPKKQTLADKIMGTVVVTVPKQPFNTVDLYTVQ